MIISFNHTGSQVSIFIHKYGPQQKYCLPTTAKGCNSTYNLYLQVLTVTTLR